MSINFTGREGCPHVGASATGLVLEKVLNALDESRENLQDVQDIKGDTLKIKDAAEAAKSGAVGAKNDAECANQDAQEAKTAAQTARTGAENANSSAQAAQASAQSAADQAQADMTATQTARTAAQNAAAQAKEASHPPYVGTNGHWYTWDTDALAFADSGVSAQGPKGEAGARGEQGPQGVQGVQGEKGEKGDTGARGATGAAGTDGKSAYRQAVDAGYTGTEAAFYAALVSLKDAPFLPLAGGSMVGNLYMNNHIVTGLPNPVSPSDAVNFNTLLRVLSGNAVVLEYSVASAIYPSGTPSHGQFIVAREQSSQANSFRFVFCNKKIEAYFTQVAGDDTLAEIRITFPGCSIVGDWSSPDLCTLTVDGGQAVRVVDNGDNVVLSIINVYRGDSVTLDGYITLGVI